MNYVPNDCLYVLVQEPAWDGGSFLPVRFRDQGLVCNGNWQLLGWVPQNRALGCFLLD